MPLTILHTGDVHLGAPFKHLGAQAREQRQQLRATFERVIDVALERNVDVFLCAGDLFDANTVSDVDVAFAKTQLERLNEASIPTVLIGGTHDCLADAAILTREGVLTAYEHIHLLTPEEPQYVLPQLDLTISGTSNTTNKSRTSPLVEFPAQASTAFHVGMIHGSLAIPGKHAKDDMPFTEEEVQATGLDYLAVGHWHSLNDISTQDVTAYYAGSPEAIDFGEHRAGHVLLVKLETGAKPVIEPIRVGKRSFERLEIDITGHTQAVDVIKKLQEQADRNKALEIILRGLRSPQLTLSQDDIQEAVGGAFFQILIKDETRLQLENIEQYADQKGVYGQFLTRMKDQIEAAETDEEKAVAELALHIGMSQLTGTTSD